MTPRPNDDDLRTGSDALDAQSFDAQSFDAGCQDASPPNAATRAPSAEERVAEPLECAADGELEALSRHMRRLARHLVEDEAAADDVVQEAWLAALRAPRRQVRDWSAWLARVVRNTARRRTRRRRRAAELEARAARPEALDDRALSDRLDTIRWLSRCVDELDPPYRDVLRLRYFEGLSFDELAARLNRPADTVRTQLKRGRAKLREQLARDPDRAAGLASLLVASAPRESGSVPRRTAEPVSGGEAAGGQDASLAPGDAPGSRAPANGGGQTPARVAARSGAGASTGTPLAWLVAASLAVATLAWLSEPRETEARLESASALALSRQAERDRPASAPTDSGSLGERSSARLGPSAVPPDGRTTPAHDSTPEAADTESNAAALRPRTLHLGVRAERSDGRVAPDAIVTVHSGERLLHRGPVDREGRASVDLRLDELTPGASGQPSVRVTVDAPGEAGSGAHVVSLPRDELTIRTTGAEAVLLARVTDAEGRAIEGARVTARPLFAARERSTAGDEVLIVSRHVHSGADGRLELHHLATSSTRVELVADGHVARVDTLELAAGENRHEWRLERGAVAIGFVRDETGTPVEGARVFLSTSLSSLPRETRSDARGAFRLEGLPPGERYLQAIADERPGLAATIVAPLTSAEPFEWDARLEAIDFLALHVVDEHGEPPRGARAAIFATVAGETWRALRALDDTGRARFDALPDADLTLVVLTPEASAFGRTAAERHGLRAKADELVVELADPEADLARLRLRVVREDGRPFEEAHVERHASDGHAMDVHALDSRDGALDLRLEPGRWRLALVCGRSGWLDLGEHALEPGGETDLGELIAPPLVAATPDEHWPADAPPGGLTLAPDPTGYPAAFEATRLHRFDERPAALRLLPGRYRWIGNGFERRFDVSR